MVQELASQVMFTPFYCPNCGVTSIPNVTFCISCGFIFTASLPKVGDLVSVSYRRRVRTGEILEMKQTTKGRKYVVALNVNGVLRTASFLHKDLVEEGEG